MPQEEEGRSELTAIKMMYQQLDSINVTPIASVGIGNGSCQFAIEVDEGKIETIGHVGGMASLDKLVTMPGTFIEGAIQHLDDLIKQSEMKRNPIIALKSGCLLLLESDRELQSQLFG